MTMTALDPVKLRAHRQEQAGLGFPLLRACPGTAAAGLIAFLDGLPPDRRIAFANEVSDLEDAQAARPPGSNAELHDLIRSFPIVYAAPGPKFSASVPERGAPAIRDLPVKLLANLLEEAGPAGIDGVAKTLGLSSDPAARSLPAGLVDSPAEIVPVAPARLRKLLDAALKQGFGAGAQRIAADYIVYDAPIQGGHMRLHAMFVAKGRIRGQFSYSLDIAKAGMPKRQTSYESVWRMPSAWDYLTEANAARSADHLKTLIATCLDLAA